jgi:GTP cyclohydrolase FolE2
MMVDVNKQRMIDNQTYVKHILQLAGKEILVDVEMDSSYNNKPQPGCEAATQTCCPLVEQCTTKKLTINIGYASEMFLE